MHSLVERCHAILATVLNEGDTAVDATVGNGHDTLFLAGRVGGRGRVYGFDIQEAALAAARRRLNEADVAQRVRLIHCGHEAMAERLPESERGRVKAVVFNLGYLPGGDKSCTTRPATTRQALEAASTLLAPGGILTVVAYTGHAGGRAEADAVGCWMAGLAKGQWAVHREVPAATRRSPPELYIARRQDGISAGRSGRTAARDDP